MKSRNWAIVLVVAILAALATLAGCASDVDETAPEAPAPALGSGLFQVERAPAVAAPVFNPAPGTYASALDVALSTITTGAIIHYTVDGTIPTTRSAVYTAPVHVAVSTTINAIAVKNKSVSVVSTATYTILPPKAQAPTFNPAGGTYTGPVDVALATGTPGADIHYTVDGTIPTSTSPVYTAPLHLASSTVVHALATAVGYTPSDVTVATYQINLPSAAAPTFNPVSGTYTGPVAVTIASITPGATIYYTLDGTDPTSQSAVYTAPIQIASFTTVKALAMAPGYLPSMVSVATYSINPPVAIPPVFDPATGTYSGSVDVTITSGTPGATIHYTVDGTTPTAASPVYTAPLHITSLTTVKALATAPGYLPSAVSVATYQITP
jgi:hypothetical protein